MDINKPVTNPQLLQAARDMQQENSAENQHRVISEAIQARFLLPVQISPPPEKSGESGETTLSKGTKISFPLLKNEEGQYYMPAFTDWEALYKWSDEPNRQTIVVPFDDLTGQVLHDENLAGFVLNPASESLPFPSALLQELRESRQGPEVQSYTVDQDTQVQLGEPEEYPQALVDAVSKHLQFKPSVNAAYLQLMVREGEQSYLMVVDFMGDKSSLFQDIAQVASPHLKGMYLDMVPFSSDFGRSAAEGKHPFYRKATPGGKRF